MTAWVYLCEDADGSALYVGSTTNLSSRLSQHQHSTRWWSQVQSVILDRCENAQDARRAEADLIRTEQPIHNVRHLDTVSTPTNPWTELIVLRSKDGMNMTDLARAASMSLGYLSDLENGKREPSARITKLLAQALNVPVSMVEKRRRSEVSA